jgi:hypothetical protein
MEYLSFVEGNYQALQSTADAHAETVTCNKKTGRGIE